MSLSGLAGLTGLSGITLPDQYYRKILSYEPIAYVPLWETNGNIAHCLVNNAQNGSFISVTLGQTGIGDGHTCPLFDGANSYVNMYTTTLRDTFDGAHGTVLVWARVFDMDTWRDWESRFFFILGADHSDNYLYICKNPNPSGGMEWEYRAGGTTKKRVKSGLSEPGWVSLALTWDTAADKMKAYWQGKQEGATLTGLGAWTGNLIDDAIMIGATNIPPQYPHYGWLAHWALWDKVLTPEQIADLADV